MSNKKGFRGNLFSFKPTATLQTLPHRKTDSHHEFLYLEDGLLIVESGKITAVGAYSELKNTLDENDITDHSGKLITPGFIDTHLHAVQPQVMAAYGEQLPEWLNQYVFPSEAQYRDLSIARKHFAFFFDQLLRNGTTTAVAYGPLFYDATTLLFEEAKRRNMCFIAGNTLMDQLTPDYLQQDADTSYDTCEKLIDTWHGTARLHYAITPRFAPACSEAMLSACQTLRKKYPTCYIQTHLDENTQEIEMVKAQFPWSQHYLDVYDQFDLIGEKSILGHCIHLNADECARIQSAGATIAWCPTSNNFLGSGLFPFAKVSQFTDKITFGSDVGAGNTFSLFRVMDDAYKVCMLEHTKLPSMVRWFMATLGAAKALQLDHEIGTLTPGKAADFIVIDPNATALTQHRMQDAEDIFEQLFILMSLADDRHIHATYLLGECAHARQPLLD